MRISAITDDLILAHQIQDVLKQYGFTLEIHLDLGQMLEKIAPDQRAVFVLDEASPAEGGYSLLRRLRILNASPVLMLLRRDTAEARIACLEAGADDCLGRPFHPRELVARVRSLLRRAEPNRDQKTIHANGVTVDTSTREAFLDGRAVTLTTVEFDILAVLMRCAGRTVSRDQLIGTLYQRKAMPFDRSVDMHVSHLRRKLMDRPSLIKTVRGEGYQLCLPWQEDLSHSAS